MAAFLAARVPGARAARRDAGVDRGARPATLGATDGRGRMRALRVRAGGLNGLRVEDVPDPGAPGPGELRVRIRASSLNYHDLNVVSADPPAVDGRVPMADGAGEVEAVGEGVADLRAGDLVVSTFFPDWLDGPPPPGAAGFARVPGDGLDGYGREAAVVPATWVTRAPQGWSAEEAATITTAGLTAWRALVVEGGLRPGDVVVCLGTGGVSVWALQVAKAAGATVIVTSSSDEKLERARALGADVVVNYREVPDWDRVVLEATGGRGADHVVEVGGQATLERSCRAARVGGRVALVGGVGGWGDRAPLRAILLRHLRVRGLVVGSRAMQADFVRALEATGIRPVVDRAYPLEAAAEAFRWQKAGGHFGKVALSI